MVSPIKQDGRLLGGGLCAVAVTGKSHEGKGLMFMDLYPTCACAALGDEMRLDSKINKL